MSKRKDGQARGKYTLEFKLEAVRLVKGGQAVPVTATCDGFSNSAPLTSNPIWPCASLFWSGWTGPGARETQTGDLIRHYLRRTSPRTFGQQH